MRPPGDALLLRPGDSVPGRPFTDLRESRADLVTVTAMRRSLRDRVRAGAGGGRWRDAGDLHWLVAPRPSLLAGATPVYAVGFFGRVREHIDHEPIGRLEHELLERASSFAGLLSYHNVRFASGQWGNLVVFAAEADAAHVRGDATHLEALTRTPEHYHSVRLHRLRLTDGPAGNRPPELLVTLLLDFDVSPPWRALRPGPSRAA